MRARLGSVILLIFAPVLAMAGPPMSKVTVHVVAAETGKPVDRASVIVKFDHGRAPLKLYRKMLTTWEARTNQEGNITLPTFPQGTVTVQVIAPNFQTYGQHMEVDADEKTLEIRLNPPQPQYSVK